MTLEEREKRDRRNEEKEREIRKREEAELVPTQEDLDFIAPEVEPPRPLKKRKYRVITESDDESDE